LQLLDDKQKEWVRKLLAIDDVPLETYKGMQHKEALNTMKQLGQDLNKDNPWMSTTKPRDLLRSRLGYWKAIGMRKNELS